ncbi:hypothetical protein K1X12_10150 [Hyphomonas sp. WL0036]|uniref:hypothetical protein n=1 Tax=Hyphomonas sediminis TaxID=2866160 RepID=UPI001C7E1FA3|nr:hypothetical protein [Hyphomonas sediminis]MBY9067262.1 hypothetical protein [Hyphomonas sediminis]
MVPLLCDGAQRRFHHLFLHGFTAFPLRAAHRGLGGGVDHKKTLISSFAAPLSAPVAQRKSASNAPLANNVHLQLQRTLELFMRKLNFSKSRENFVQLQIIRVLTLGAQIPVFPVFVTQVTELRYRQAHKNHPM